MFQVLLHFPVLLVGLVADVLRTGQAEQGHQARLSRPGGQGEGGAAGRGQQVCRRLDGGGGGGGGGGEGGVCLVTREQPGESINSR